jgi:site-specific DNA-cytosine methylase
MTSKKLIIDICSGMGGATQSFLNNPDYEVIKLDSNIKVKPTILCDIRYLPIKNDLRPELVWCSPPCTNLSFAKYKNWVNHNIKETFSIIGGCLDAIYRLKPKKWVLENPKGRLRWFMSGSIEIEYATYDMPKKKTNLWSNNNRALKRAFIPKHISDNILNWCEEK